jgi:hypothetical protein
VGESIAELRIYEPGQSDYVSPLHGLPLEGSFSAWMTGGIVGWTSYNTKTSAANGTYGVWIYNSNSSGSIDVTVNVNGTESFRKMYFHNTWHVTDYVIP